MAQIIFAVEKPSNMNDHQNEQRWRGCAANLSDLAATNTDIQLLGENVLLISLNHNLNTLSAVIQKLMSLGYRYQVLTEDIQLIAVQGKV